MLAIGAVGWQGQLRRTSWCTVFAAVLLVPTPANLSAQGCPHIPAGSGETVEGFVRKSDLSCTATHDGYIRQTTGVFPNAAPTYRIDIHATSGGTCTLRTYQWQTQSCVNQATTPNPQNRGIVGMRVDIVAGQSCNDECAIGTPMSPVNGSNQITNQDQDVDSRITGSVYNNNVPVWHPVVTGTTTLRYRSTLYSTGCSMTPTVKEAQFVVHVLECKPEWFVNNTSPFENYHGPASGDITIAIPSSAYESARGPAQQAASDWATALGRTITVVPGYTTCNPIDPRCLQLTDNYTGSACASFGPGNSDPSGVYNSSTTINFKSNWNSGNPHPTVLRFIIAHEMGHYFGLQNRLGPGCDLTNTVMGYRDTNCYDSNPLPVDYAKGPTPEDISPIVNATYGNNVRSSCGF